MLFPPAPPPQPVADVVSQQHLRSATQQLLVIPRHQLSSYGRRAFCVAGPLICNSLPDNLWDAIIGGNSFRQFLETFLFAMHSVHQSFHDNALYKSTFCLLTYSTSLQYTLGVFGQLVELAHTSAVAYLLCGSTITSMTAVRLPRLDRIYMIKTKQCIPEAFNKSMRKARLSYSSTQTTFCVMFSLVLPTRPTARKR